MTIIIILIILGNPTISPEMPPPLDSDGERWLRAIIYKESQNTANAVGDGGRAVGCLQIHKIMVRDVNRFGASFTYSDRWDCDKSKLMFRWYIHSYGFTTWEQRARAWNGGPIGYRKRSTYNYWKSVQGVYKWI